METRKKPHLTPEGQDLKEEETEAKMRVLWTFLIILVLALIAAIVYEIVLGNGMRQTGSERMEETGLESEMSGEATGEELLIKLPGSSGEETNLQTETNAAAAKETEAKEAEAAETEAKETEAADTAAQQQGTGQQDTGQTEETVGGNEPALAGIGGV